MSAIDIIEAFKLMERQTGYEGIANQDAIYDDDGQLCAMVINLPGITNYILTVAEYKYERWIYIDYNAVVAATDGRLDMLIQSAQEMLFFE